jgi:hypothetical protein
MPLDTAIGPVFARITPADAMVIDFSIKNQVVALWKSLFEARVQKAQNGPSTQLSEATSCVKRSDTRIKAEELHNFSSYQTLIMDKNWQNYQAAMKLVKKLAWAPIAVKLLRTVSARRGTSSTGPWS